MPSSAGVLLDIDGTLLERPADAPARSLPGAVEAVSLLARRGPVRFVTNMTSRPRTEVRELLARTGFEAQLNEIYMPATLARTILVERGDAEGILIESDPRTGDLDWFRTVAPGQARAVLVASEAHELTVRELMPAVEALLAGARLYALQDNRVYKSGEALVPDVGPLTAYLGYAANTNWETFGKPSPLLFQQIAKELGLPLAELLMTGDDAEFDVAGALGAGVGSGVLVKTGKYRDGDETRFSPRPTAVLGSVADLPAALS